MPATLWSIRYSPWSVRVRWALGVLKYDFTVLSYASVFLREWRLRLLMRKWNVTVPVLVDKKVRIMGGKEILEHVQEQMGAGPKLIRQGVDDWLQIAEEVMENERCGKLLEDIQDVIAVSGEPTCLSSRILSRPFFGFVELHSPQLATFNASNASSEPDILNVLSLYWLWNNECIGYSKSYSQC